MVPSREWKSQTFSISGTFADCLPASSTALATACESNVLQYDNGGDNTCISTASCITMTIAETSPLGTPIASRYMCGEYWFYDTIYRVLPTSTTATVTSSEATTTSISKSTPSINAPARAPSTASGSSSLSGGAIAGIVIGGIAAVALLAAFFLRKKIAACFGDRKEEIYEAPYAPAPTKPGGLYEIGSSGSQTVPPNNEVYEIGSSGPKEHDGLNEADSAK
ncbi:hypothetical protein LT330_010168 [Penicillium expansum]|nr:hypothetical protein LT330_010168 [Penicillium expansum]KGO41599.1 hypothetical protein PEXP_088230 [Penicillium expansum]KGO65971.1 hypothetical protein PEX1_037080 [Penicillium expansum]